LLVIIIYFPAFFLLILFDLNPALLNKLKVKKRVFLRKLGVNSSFFNFPVNNLGNSTWQGPIRTFFSMKNNFINNNGATLLHTKNKKTKVESRIDELKQQKQAIITEL